MGIPVQMMLLATGPSSPPRQLEYVIVGGGGGGTLGTTTYGIDAYGGDVVQGTYTFEGADTSFVIAVGSGGAASSGAGSNSSLVGNVSFSVSAVGGSTNTSGRASSVSTWAGTFSGQGQTQNKGGGGKAGSCWWATAGFPNLCTTPYVAPGPGTAGIVVIREAISAPLFASGNWNSYSTTATHRVYTWTTGGSFAF
jgi:hypothetical protein